MQKDKSILLLFLTCLALTLFIHVYVFPQLPIWFADSFRTYDGMVVPYGTNTVGLSLSVLVTFLSLLPIFFLILVTVHFFTRHRTKMLDYMWTMPIQKISDCTRNIPEKKISFLVLSTTISTMTMFTAVHTTTAKLFSSFSDIVGFFDLAGVYNDISGMIKPSELASEALIGQFGIFAFLLFGVGPIWLLLIGWAKKEEIKHPGPRMLLSYLYTLTIILVFVQVGFFMASDSVTENSDMMQTNNDPSCSSERDVITILEFTLYGETMVCQSLNFAVIILVSALTSIFAYFVGTRILHSV